MSGLVKVCICIAFTTLGLVAFTATPGDRALTVVAGLPVVTVGFDAGLGWIGIGQTARGLLVFAQGGYGLVAFTQGGIGVIFGVGQGMLGLLAIGQVGVGLFGFVGQLGFGAQAVVGWRNRGKAWNRALSSELQEVLTPLWRKPT